MIHMPRLLGVRRNRRRRQHRGFTIVELLLVIGVIGLLLAIGLPAIGKARRSAMETLSLTNLKSIGVSVTMYQGTYDNAFPYGKRGWIIQPHEGHPISTTFYTWGIYDNWPVLFHDVAPWSENYPIWFSPGYDPTRLSMLPGGENEGQWSSGAFRPSYRYCTTFIADPKLWSEGAGADERLVRAIRGAEVKHPSLKALMYDGERNYYKEVTEDTPRPVLMVDGSAATHFDRDATEPVRNPLRGDPPWTYHDTPNGVHGRDF